MIRRWYAFTARLRSLLLRRRRDEELAEELRSHVERETERLQANGVPPEAAVRQALHAFGGIEQMKEASRDTRGTAAFDAVARDTRYAARRLVRDWPFTAAAVLILSVGIGANTAIFSAVNAALFRERPFAEPDRLVEIYQNVGESGAIGGNSYPAYRDMAEYTGIFAATTTTTPPIGVSYADRGALRRAVAEHTTASYLSVLGLRPSLGRWFEPSEDRLGAAVVAVVGHQAWTTRFDSDPYVVGRTIRIEGVPVTIVGVGPAGHIGTLDLGIATDFWLPVSALPALGGAPRVLERNPEEPAFFVKARLRDGVTVAQAQAAMDILGARLAADYPDEDPGQGITVLASSGVRVHPQIDVVLTAAATVLLVLVGLVLAIACSNLATLLLVRGAARAREVSVRLALGATRGRLVRHLLTENLLLAAAGGVGGCIVAWWAIQSLRVLDLPFIVDLRLDYRVLTFAVLVSVATGLAAGLAPALRATKVDVLPALKDEGGMRAPERRFALKNALVVFQVAVSVVLLAGTSLFLQMLGAARVQHVGFAIEGVAMLETDARYSGYAPAEAMALYEELRRRVAAIPGVESVALARGLPMRTTGALVRIENSNAAAGPVFVASRIWAGPSSFDTLRIPVLAGRVFDERDGPDAPSVAVISESMARQSFGTINPVGRRFRLENDPESWMEVIGVVRDTATANLGEHLVDPQFYLFFRSFMQSNGAPSTVIARTSLDAAGLVAAMERELRQLDPTLPVVSARTMEAYLEDSLLAPRVAALFLGGLGAVGVCLASIGLYAVVAFAVSRRSREIAIRMALGAQTQQVARAVTRDVAVLAGIGTTIGLALAIVVILAVRVIPALGANAATNISIYRPAVDPVALVSIAALMGLVALAAAYVPARRAARVDPLVALRHE